MTRSLLAAAALLIATVAFAGPEKGKSAASGPKCPGGGNYTLKQTPSKGHTSKVNIDGKTYYACKNCADKMNKKESKQKTAAKKSR